MNNIGLLDALHPVAPGLQTALAVLNQTYTAIENVKIHRQQCLDMSNRCATLLQALLDSSAGLEGTEIIQLADEAELIIRGIHAKLVKWSSLSHLRSFMSQSEIREGIAKSQRDIDNIMMKFNTQSQLELRKVQRNLADIQERDRVETRELLLQIIQNTDDVRTLLGSSPEAVDHMMGALQQELQDPNIQPSEERTFMDGLWTLHEETLRLPPLSDLTGQIRRDGKRPVAMGSFNDVYKGTWLDKQAVALRLPRLVASASEIQRRFQREVTNWRKLQHPNIVPFLGTAQIEEGLVMVSTWMDNGTSMAYLANFPDADRLQLVGDVAQGLEYLHSQQMVHGDLRGSNVLISGDGIACLSDFGLSKILEEVGQGMSSTTTSATNPRWTSPELIKHTGRPSTASDIWSFGMLILELMTGEKPYAHISRDMTVMHEITERGKLPPRPGPDIAQKGLTDDLWDLMRKCWSKKPESRPSIALVRTKLVFIMNPNTAKVSSYAPSIAPSTISVTKRLSGMFDRVRRPSTASSEHSTTSTPSRRPRITFLGSPQQGADRIVEEPSEISPANGGLSPLSVIPTGSGHRRASGTYSPSIRTTSSKSSGDRRSTTSSSHGAPPISSSLPSSFGSQLLHFPTSLEDGGISSPSSSPALPPEDDSSLVHRAITDPTPIYNLSSDGSVSSGTLEGLLERLLTSTHLDRDVEFRDSLLTTCTDFASPDELFMILIRRFNDANANVDLHVENRGAHAERLVAIRINALGVVKYWISSHHIEVSPQLRWQIKEFALSTLSSDKFTPRIKENVKEIIRLVDDRQTNGGVQNTSPLLSPGRRIPRSADISPHDLAIALTLLEGDKIAQIIPAQLIAHLSSQPQNAVNTLLNTHRKLSFYVKKSILHSDRINLRGIFLKFFVNAAHECYLMHNYGSMAVIVKALTSGAISRLKLTHGELPQEMKDTLSVMARLVDGNEEYNTYKAALHKCHEPCVPWLEPHVHSLNKIFAKNPRTKTIDDRILINFDRYSKFTQEMRGLSRCKPPDLEEYRSQGQLAYLEHQLRNDVTDGGEYDLEQRSRVFAAEENRVHTQRLNELHQLGFS